MPRPSEAYEFVSGRLTLAGRIGLKATRVEQSPSKFEISGLKKGVVCVSGLSSLTNFRYLPVPRLIPSMLARFTITVSDLLIKGSMRTDVAESRGQEVGRAAFWTLPKMNRPLDLVLLDVLWETEGAYQIGVNLLQEVFGIARLCG